MYGAKFIGRRKKRFWRDVKAIFDTILSEIDLGNVDTWQVDGLKCEVLTIMPCLVFDFINESLILYTLWLKQLF